MTAGNEVAGAAALSAGEITTPVDASSAAPKVVMVFLEKVLMLWCSDNTTWSSAVAAVFASCAQA